ncbi:unnamed protein product [Victoria cruziana]
MPFLGWGKGSTVQRPHPCTMFTPLGSYVTGKSDVASWDQGAVRRPYTYNDVLTGWTQNAEGCKLDLGREVYRSWLSDHI